MGRAIFRLKKIEIQSFITEFQAKEMLTINGGNKGQAEACTNQNPCYTPARACPAGSNIPNFCANTEAVSARALIGCSTKPNNAIAQMDGEA